jgi:hypothetical protein
MFRTEASSVPMCTVRRHPIGGYTPVLHLSNAPAPAPSVGTISFPRIAQARQYARDHFGTGMIRVADDCPPETHGGGA